MATHFKWYPSSEETIVPWFARYPFPSQSNRCYKTTPRIPPKSGGTFNPSSTIRVEFPASGYVNPLNTTFEFDVTLTGYDGTVMQDDFVRIQNNVQSCFERVKLWYGSTTLEDIPRYNVIVRMLTEWTGTNQNSGIDQTSIAEGIGGVVTGFDVNGVPGLVNVRQNYIQGYDGTTNTAAAFTLANGVGNVPNAVTNPNITTVSGKTSTRRYQVSFALGLFTQDKLIPTKFMASQLAIDITLADPATCLYTAPGTFTTQTATPTYLVSNVNLIPEILEFDASYDEMFLTGLREGGVPIKFSSWNVFLTSTQASSNLNVMISERSRSVKAIFSVQRRATPVIYYDSGALLYDTSANTSDLGGTLQQFQYRIGNKYYPSSPVQCSTTPGSAISNGAAEAFLELQKALNCVGDYRLSANVSANRWAIPPSVTASKQLVPGGTSTAWPELDYASTIVGWSNGCPKYQTNSGFMGGVGACAFAMSTNLETSNGVEISGLNAEEQVIPSLILV